MKDDRVAQQHQIQGHTIGLASYGDHTQTLLSLLALLLIIYTVIIELKLAPSNKI